MMRIVSALLLLGAISGAVPGLTSAACAASVADAQELVDRATLAAQDVLTAPDGSQAVSLLRRARAVVICPRVFKAGFLFGGEGGGCVLLARGGGGSWSAPAFYAMGGGSFGLQAGIQDAEIMMIVLTNRGLRAIMDSQFKFGADASIALVTIGGGIEGATTAALDADIVAYARTRGLFAGVSLQGSVLASDSAADQVYYGQPVGPIDIVVAMRVNNPGADPLRALLMRYGGATPLAPAAAGPGYGAPNYAGSEPGYAPASDAAAPAPAGAVQQEALPPPH